MFADPLDKKRISANDLQKEKILSRSGLHYRNGSRVKIDRDLEREIRIEISGIDLSRSKITVQKSLRREQRSDNRTVRVGGKKMAD